jgi:hypothetical protein
MLGNEDNGLLARLASVLGRRPAFRSQAAAEVICPGFPTLARRRSCRRIRAA